MIGSIVRSNSVVDPRVVLGAAPEPVAPLRAYASKMLSDVGGEVIIVEPPGGDHLRRWKKSALLGLSDPLSPGEDGALFHYLHGNKKSVVIDKSSEIDQQRLADLCAGADLVICDSRSGLLASYHLDSERLRANNPRLSIVEISAYGRDEPGVATEFTLQAEVGSTDSRGGYVRRRRPRHLADG